MHVYFPHLHTIPVLCPLSSPYTTFWHAISHKPYFTPLLPFLEEVNMQLGYRGQNASQKHERNCVSEHNILFLSARQSRLAGGIILSNCPFVRLRLSMRSFVRLLPTSEHYNSRNSLNRSTDFNANWHKSSPGARAWTVDFWDQKVIRSNKGQGHKRLKLYLEAWHHRGMQWATEMLPVKMGRGQGVAHSCLLPPRVLLTHSLSAMR